jgi:hypothetical protein
MRGVSSESFVSILECITLLTHLDESTRTTNCCEFSAIFEIDSHASSKVFSMNAHPFVVLIMLRSIGNNPS